MAPQKAESFGVGMLVNSSAVTKNRNNRTETPTEGVPVPDGSRASAVVTVQITRTLPSRNTLISRTLEILMLILVTYLQKSDGVIDFHHQSGRDFMTVSSNYSRLYRVNASKLLISYFRGARRSLRDTTEATFRRLVSMSFEAKYVPTDAKSDRLNQLLKTFESEYFDSYL